VTAHQRTVWSISWSKSADVFATGSSDSSVRLWRWNPDDLTLESTHCLEGHTRKTHCVGYSPCGNRVASGGWDKKVRIWSVGGGEPCVLDVAHQVVSVCWIGESENLAVGTKAEDIAMFDGEGQSRILAVGNGQPIALACSPDGTRLAVARLGKTIQILNIAEGKECQGLRSIGSEIVSLAWSPDGKMLATGLQKGWVRVWDVDGAEQLWNCRGHAAEVTCVAWSPSGEFLASASADETLVIWDTKKREQAASFQSLWGELLAVAWRPQIASGEKHHLAISMREHVAMLQFTCEP